MKLRSEVRDGVLVVTIARPEVRNCVDRETAEALGEAFRLFAEDDSLRVAILQGEGGCFCAGADLKEASVGGARANKVLEEGDGPMGPTRMLLEKPVIAAVEGYAVAGGLELALWCDLRVAASDAVFGVYCRRWGVPLVDGGTIRLPRLIGQSRAMDMILTGRGVFGEEALSIGLVNRMVEKGGALEASVALAQEIGEFPQRCMRSDRRSVLTQWGMELDDALREETRLGIEVIRSGETQEGATRFAKGAGRHGSSA
ncbi:MAG: crotonase/enoyl-CoA hydratase family protein [bacterium]|nr:enoyl-CoA hydratase [Deltaproteobacteria bacterium]MCP4904595.1 crotonase/enoyl-CoA hydratase family protein [bacterium]